MLPVANMFSIIGIGLLPLFLLRLLPLFNNWEKVTLAIPLGLGINGWLLFMLGSCGYLNQATSLLILLSGVIALLCFVPHLKLSVISNLSPISYLLITIIIYVFLLDFLEGFLPPGDADTLAYHFAIPKVMSETGFDKKYYQERQNIISQKCTGVYIYTPHHLRI